MALATNHYCLNTFFFIPEVKCSYGDENMVHAQQSKLSQVVTIVNKNDLI